MNAPAYLRPDQTAERCSVSERTIRDWQRRGILPYFKPTRKVTLFSVADIDKALRKFRVQAVGDRPDRLGGDSRLSIRRPSAHTDWGRETPGRGNRGAGIATD